MPTAAELLTGRHAADLLQTALTGRPGGHVPRFRSTVDAVHDRIGAETSVTYHVTYADGEQERHDYLVATTAEVSAAAVVEAEGHTIRVWRHPADPRLPGLAGACTPAVLDTWLPEPSGGPAHTEVLVYRPLRRAVLRTARDGQVYFTKVVRPDPGKLLARRHELLAGIGPEVIARPVPGVLITAQSPGTSLAVALSAWQLGETDTRPAAADALALLDALPDSLLDLPARPSWTDRVDFHSAMAAAALPAHAAEITHLAAEISAMAADFPVGPVVPTHGDFHDGNIFCAAGRPDRLIDIDTVGPGRREDDLACLIAHLAVLPSLSAQHYPRGAEIADEWAQQVERTVHPGALRARVAGVLLSLVSGAGPNLSLTRLDLARTWAWRARAAG